MSANTVSNTMYDNLPAAFELNKVPGFDPRRFLRKKFSESGQEEVLDLDLKYKKLWFRLVHSNGRIKVTALKITEQVAIVEAKIFFDKNDSEPVSGFIAQRYVKQSALYIERAQYVAQDQALTDAGFGIQFSPASPNSASERQREGVPEDKVAAQTAADLHRPPIQENVPAQVGQETAANAETTPAPEAPGVINLPDILEQAGSGVTGLPDIPEQPEVQTEATASADAFGQSEALALAQDVTSERPQTADIPEEPFECGESAETQDAVSEAPRYTTDTPVDEICALMTLEEAQAVIVDVGTCNGWTLGEVIERRPASLKWYLNGYSGENNMLRAGAKLLLENSLKRKAG